MTLNLHPEFLKLSNRRRYLLACSGGRDSVALLHALLDAGVKNLVVCHLNHKLRGRDSGQDASFVRRLAQKHGIPCEIGQIGVAQRMTESGESLELAARRARHSFLADCARKYRCPRILLGHHADDQAETILFNLLRGSGGLRGIRFASDITVDKKSFTLLRPLLLTTRDEIDTFVTERQIPFREDTSNAEPIAARNRIRNEVMPLLNDIMQRDVSPALIRALHIFDQNQEALEDTLTSLDLLDPQGRIFLPKLAPLPPAIQRSFIHSYLKQAQVPGISTDVLERCLSLIDNPATSKINLPGGQHFRRKEKRLFISN